MRVKPSVPAILAVFAACSMTWAGPESSDVQKTLATLTEHTIRLEEQNKAILEQLRLLERQMDKRFEQVDKRFEQIDKRFEQVDKRFEQVDKRIDLLTWMFGVMMSLVAAGIGYLIYLVKGL